MKMNELQQSSEAAQWLSSAWSAVWATLVALFWKFMPAPLGALVMISVKMPKSRGELFWRLMVACIASMMLGELVFDFLHSLSWLAFLNASKRSHTAGVDFIVGASGWFVVGAVGWWLDRLRGNPLQTAEETRKVLR